MFYIVYKITNTINGKIYVGCHKTSNLDDGYMGSGKLLRRAFLKYGVENFRKEILEIFDNPTHMFELEAEIVNEDFVNSDETYNVGLGGSGGSRVFGNHHTHSKEHLDDMRRKSIERWDDPSFKEKRSKEISEKNKEKHESGKLKHIYFGTCEWQQRAIQKAHSTESWKKRSETRKRIKFQQGKNNSQYGTRWITDGSQNKKIKKTDSIPDGWKSGRTCTFTAG